MKYLAISLFLIFCTQVGAQSYYYKYQLKFDITTDSEESLILYREIGAFYFDLDSIHNQEYLKSSLRAYGSTVDSLSFYENSIEYFYCIADTINCPDSEKESVLALLDKVILGITDIKRIEVLETKVASNFEYISTPLQISDTAWMKKPSLRAESFYTNLCSHKIHIYKNSQQLDNLISELEITQAEINSLIDEDQLNYDNDLI